MLNRVVLAAFLFPTVLAPGFGQSRDTASRTLEDILSELRAIHQDMRVTETTQLLVAELEMRQSLVNRATESADNARAKLADVRRDQKQVAAELQQAEELLDQATNSDDKNGIKEAIERHKSNIEVLKTVERDSSMTLQDFEQRLTTAQDRLAEIESELTAAISQLGPARNDADHK